MNRGFGFYFKNAMKASCRTIWKNKNFFGVLAYLFSSVLAKITVLFSSVFCLADVRQAKVVQKQGKSDFAGTFSTASRAKQLGTIIMTIILESFIVLGGLAVIALVTALLGLLGYILSAFLKMSNFQLLVLIFSAPGLIAAVAYLFVMTLLFAPSAYVVDTNPQLTASEVIKICFDTMKSRGKLTCFLNVFVPFLVIAAIGAISWGGQYVITNYLYEYTYMPVFRIIWLVVCVLLFVLVVPMFELAGRIAQNSLFEDIAQDPVNANKHTVGVNIKKCNGIKFDPSSAGENLTSLFDETQTDSIPAETSPSRRKKENKAKLSVKPAPVSEPEAEPTPAESLPAAPEPTEAAFESETVSESETPVATDDTPVALDDVPDIREDTSDISAEDTPDISGDSSAMPSEAEESPALSEAPADEPEAMTFSIEDEQAEEEKTEQSEDDGADDTEESENTASNGQE